MEHFSKIIADEQGTAKKNFSDESIKALQNFSWTGNIRELRNVVERLIILGQSPVTADDVSKFVKIIYEIFKSKIYAGFSEARVTCYDHTARTSFGELLRQYDCR